MKKVCSRCLIGWLLVVLINVDLAIFQPYLDLEAGDNQSLKIQVARRGIEPRSSCSASQELNHSATAAPADVLKVIFDLTFNRMKSYHPEQKLVYYKLLTNLNLWRT